MNRETVINAIKQAAATSGYKFHCDDEQQMLVAVKEYPTLWLTPPQFLKIEGRKSGKITYSVKVYGMVDGVRFSPAERLDKLNRLEEDVMQMFAAVSQNEAVVAVNNLKMNQELQSRTRQGELVMTATAEVVTHF